MNKQGLTVVEAMVAIAILGIITAAVMTTFVNSIRFNADAGKRTQSAQLLNYLGRRVAGGEGLVLAGADDALEWTYGELDAAFPELSGEEGFANPDFYRASVSNMGEIALDSASIIHYRIEVCVRANGDENCVRGDTAGPPPIPAGGTPPPPFVN